VAAFAGCSPAGTSGDRGTGVKSSALVTGPQKLMASDGTEGDYFGAVALSGDTAVIGNGAARWDQTGGHAYVFVRAGSSWIEQQNLTLVESSASVAISGDTILVGTSWVDAARVFTRAGSSWALQAELRASDGRAGDSFGIPVALSGDTALVSALGDIGSPDTARRAVYVFVRSATRWREQQKLAPLDAIPNNDFGFSIALEGDTAAISAPCRYNTTAEGAVYVFVRSGSIWAQQQKLTRAGQADCSSTAGFGGSVALSGDALIVGGGEEASVYVRSGSSWTAQQRLVASDGIANNLFGASVAVYGDRVLVGAPDDGTRESGIGLLAAPGAAYLFMRSGSTWTAQQKLTAPGGHPMDFGRAVALSADTLLIAAPLDDIESQKDQGSAYAFLTGQGIGDSCSTGADCISRYCSDGRCCDRACDGPCDACSVAAGAGRDGECALLRAGDEGSPACGTMACTGASAQCAHCARDADCPDVRYCAADGSCQPRRPPGQSCDVAAGADCKVVGCRVCQTGECTDRVCGPVDITCPNDHTALIGNQPRSCGAYACVAGIGCRTSCELAEHCAAGYSCHPDTNACVSPTGSLPRDSGCGCAVAGSRPAAWLAALALLVLPPRRRRAAPASAKRRG
jgi:MYXO-CTERM domain-containing protein